MSHSQALTYYLGAFVDELAALQVNDVVISPGSRSTPLALLMAEHEDITTYLHVDERSAAFFALGIAKAKKQPVAVLCTSGTAAANFFPAVCEAYHSRIPLIILTADRPHELRDVGAPQAINQMQLYGSFVKKFFELALPESSEMMYRYIRSSLKRAVAIAKNVPKGPVHMNFPIREPLMPDFTLESIWDKGRREIGDSTWYEIGKRTPSQSYLTSLANRISAIEKGIIVCGYVDDPKIAEAVVQLAQVLQYPVLADPISQLRSGSHDKTYIIDCYDTFLRSGNIAGSWEPDVILRFGSMPVSKTLTQFIKKQTNAIHITVDEAEEWRDPARITSEIVFANETEFCKELATLVDPKPEGEWIRLWTRVNVLAKKQLYKVEDYEEAFEGKVITEVANMLPEGAALFLSNSMPIRDADTFLFNTDKHFTVLANRGVNGIDGIISTALGASVTYSPLVLIIGDLSFYHDLNGLLAAKLHHLDATIIVVNNDGGGIFSFLPQHEEKKHFESLFGTPLGLNYEHVVTMYNGVFSRPKTWSQFRERVEAGISSNGLHVIELNTDRESNVRIHRELWSSITERISMDIHHD